MATSGPTQLPAYFNTDADFRSYCQGVNAALAACGLVQTTDTGQINNTTVTKPGAANTQAGYEIWKFNDTLQSSKPIYLRVAYGSGGAADRPSLWLHVGTQTNGAGTLSGQLTGSAVQLAQGNSAAAGNTLPMYCSGAQSSSDARITIMCSVDGSSAARSHGFHVERTNDSSGNPSGDGIFWMQFGAGAHLWSAVMGSTTGSIPAGEPNAWVLPMANIASGTTGTGGKTVFGGDTAVCPFFGILGKISVQKLFVYNDADLGGGASATLNLFGGSHTIMPLGAGVKSNTLTPSSGSFNAQCLAMMWE